MACKTHIAHIAHIAWTRGRVGVQRLGAASMPGRWRAILLQYCGDKSQPRSNFESNRGGVSMQGIPAFPVSLSLEGDSQMAYILPERLLTLVRPAFDLVLRRIRSLKRCVEACGCNIETPRYALQFGSRLHFKRCQALPKETPFPFFSGTPFFGTFFSFFFCFSLALQRLARLKCNLEPNCKHI